MTDSAFNHLEQKKPTRRFVSIRLLLILKNRLSVSKKPIVSQCITPKAFSKNNCLLYIKTQDSIQNQLVLPKVENLSLENCHLITYKTKRNLLIPIGLIDTKKLDVLLDSRIHFFRRKIKALVINLCLK